MSRGSASVATEKKESVPFSIGYTENDSDAFADLLLQKSKSFRVDPYFRLTRDVAARLEFIKPALIESKFLPALRGNNGKMSASDANSAIYINDSAADLKKKINSAVSGGRDNKEDQKKYGANLKEDVPFQYLSFFLEDDAELEHIRKEYGEGRMLTGTVKKRLIQVLTENVESHRRARAAVTEEMVNAFMAARSLPNMFE